MQKTIQSFIQTCFQILFQGIIIGIVIAISMMSIEYVLGRTFEWNHELVKNILYYILFSVVLTLINGLFFRYMNYHLMWSQEREKLRILLMILGSIVLTMIGIFFVRLFIMTVFENEPIADFLKNEKPSFYVIAMVITLIVSLVYHTVHFYRKVQENKVKEQKLIAGNASAQFESLKNQIDPHFLFNSLNVLSSLIEEHPENAQKFTTSLSKIYRYVLEQKDKELVTVEEELSFAKTYMQLLSMRFENSLTYSLPEQIPNEEAKVVPLSLQLLLENTIKHNIVSDAQPLHIAISIENGFLVVSNNLQKKEVLQKREGVGLKNIVSRYAILTDKNVSIETSNTYFKVKLPLLTKTIQIMKNNDFNETDAFYKAQKRVTEIKEFYGNLISYIFVIPLLIFINYQTYWEFKWFWFPLLGWGLGLTIHGFTVFGYGRDWEERKIREFMEKEQHKNNTKWE